MRRVIIISVSVMLAALLAFMVKGIHKGLHHESTGLLPGSALPAFTYCDLDGGHYSSADVGGGPLLIVHFDPDCEHCEYEIEGLFGSRESLKGCKVLLVTGADTASARSFVRRHGLLDYHSFVVLLDTAYQFDSQFGTGLIPANFIYDSDLRLVKLLEGEYKTETILKYLRAFD